MAHRFVVTAIGTSSEGDQQSASSRREAIQMAREWVKRGVPQACVSRRLRGSLTKAQHIQCFKRKPSSKRSKRSLGCGCGR